MPEDYVMRLIEQISIMLAELARMKAAEKPAHLSALSLRETGLPFDLVKRSAPDTILRLLESGGGTQHARAVILAELLLQDAELCKAAGRNPEAAVSHAQAHALLAHTIDHLSEEEQAVYRPKLEALALEFKRAVRGS